MRNICVIYILKGFLQFCKKKAIHRRITNMLNGHFMKRIHQYIYEKGLDLNKMTIKYHYTSTIMIEMPSVGKDVKQWEYSGY